MKKIFWYVWQTDIRTGKRECVGAFDNPEDALERLEWCINSDNEMHQWCRYTYKVSAVNVADILKGVTA